MVQVVPRPAKDKVPEVQYVLERTVSIQPVIPDNSTVDQFFNHPETILWTFQSIPPSSVAVAATEAAVPELPILGQHPPLPLFYHSESPLIEKPRF